MSEAAGSIGVVNVTRTTPPRPLDVAAVLPRLAPPARTATRLRPRRGTPSPHDSSVGGPLLWTADEPWPHCEVPHPQGGHSPAALRVEQRVRARTAMLPDDPAAARYTPQEEAVLEGIDWDLDWPNGPVPLLPLAQLYVRDVPSLRPHARAGTDLLQVLWCPFDHPPEDCMPETALFWRSAASVTDVLTAPPESALVEWEEYVAEPCLLSPEQITEYPDSMEPGEELREPLRDLPGGAGAPPHRADAVAGSRPDAA